MNKYNLGFATHLVSAGSREPRVWNSGPWAKRVGDRRNFLKYFDGLTHERIITSIDFDTEGYLLTLVRSIVGRSGDSRSVWVYVPNTIKITAEELCQVYSFAQRVLLAKEGELNNEIEECVGRNYPEADFCPAYEPSTSTAQKYAIRYLNMGYTLEELFGNLYQRYYTAYKGVFFIDKQEGLSLTAEASGFVEDLTAQRLEHYGILLPATTPPTANYRIYHNGEVFNKALHLKIGDRITLIAKRKDFNDHNFEVLIQDAITKCPTLENIVWKRTIDPNSIHVFNHKGKALNDVTLYLHENNKRQKLWSSKTLTEEAFKKARVEVECDDYTSQTVSLRSAITSPITLMPKPKIREVGQDDEADQGSAVLGILFGLIMVGCSWAIYTFMLHNIDFSGAIMAMIAGGVTLLVYIALYALKLRNNSVFGSFIGILVGVLLWLGYFAFFLDGTTTRPNGSVDSVATQKDSTAKDTASYTKTIEDIKPHLRGDKVHQDSLAQCKETAKLFEQLNNYNFTELQTLSLPFDSINKLWNDVRSKSGEMANAGKTMSSPYTKDKEITLQSWIDKVKVELKKPTESPNAKNKPADKPKAEDNKSANNPEKQQTEPSKAKGTPTGNNKTK